YNNYALLLEKTGNLEEAGTYYLLSMKYAHTDQEYYLTLCSYTELLIAQGKVKEALKNITEILQETRNNSMRKQHLIFRYYQFLLKDREERAMEFLEIDVLPYLEKHFFIEDYNKFALSLANYYSTRDKDKAFYYYKTIAER